MEHSFTLVGVGVGPGDPNLVTMAAVKTLTEADLIIAPTSQDSEPGRAETIVRKLLPDLNFVRLVFDMSKGDEGAESRRQSAREAVARLANHIHRNNILVAFITLGDPNAYSTFGLIARYARDLFPNVKISTIPGIMAFQAVLSDSPLELADENESLVVLSGLSPLSTIENEIARNDRAVVIYKGGNRVTQIKKLLQKYGRTTGTLVGKEVGLSSSNIARIDTIDHPLPYLTTIVIPPKRDPEQIG